ncbi:response regulator [Bordetella genomosp. 13]|uniref:Two-component system response regulator n=1 Tax=Bordetella genomosp. 13 TaxID=463040 RepID=A0A1W6ZDB6_9BORD|nr:HD domain-containing phosphohydrolase [Bordetella genomosp. 13]ARP95351.1 two-component system response regulator [Bordetella genomosp. 13]
MRKIVDARPTLLLVDDEPTNLQVLRHTLQDDYRLFFARDGLKGMELARMEQPDLILLDVMMPGISGYEVCAALKQDTATETIPIIFVTALANTMDEQYGFDLGAVDYITKPYSPAIVKARVRNHLSLVQVQVLRDTRLQIIQRLGAAAEYKDNETGLHVIRMSHYAKVLALAAGYSATAAEEVLNAAPMHDIGKIGIPDAILKKPGKLTDEEWVVMRRHPIIGGKIIGDHRSGLLRMARIIAEGHHEKWDGTGYPRGLRGEQIPHVARIVALADVFDALTSERPYKAAWPVDEAVAHIVKESGTHFDPELVPLFVECLPELLAIRDQWVDTDASRIPLF